MNISDKELAIFVGSKIKEYRKRAKLTQKELGQKINKSNNTISEYEKGVTTPGQDALFAIAASLNIKVDDLFPARNTITTLEDFKSQLNDLDTTDMLYLKKLVFLVESLDESERKDLMNNIKVAVQLFQKDEK